MPPLYARTRARARFSGCRQNPLTGPFGGFRESPCVPLPCTCPIPPQAPFLGGQNNPPPGHRSPLRARGLQSCEVSPLAVRAPPTALCAACAPLPCPVWPFRACTVASDGRTARGATPGGDRPERDRARNALLPRPERGGKGRRPLNRRGFIPRRRQTCRRPAGRPSRWWYLTLSTTP